MQPNSKTTKLAKSKPARIGEEFAKQHPADIARIDLANLLSRTARNTILRADEVEEARIAKEQLEAAQKRYNRALAKLAIVLIESLDETLA